MGLGSKSEEFIRGTGMGYLYGKAKGTTTKILRGNVSTQFFQKLISDFKMNFERKALK